MNIEFIVKICKIFLIIMINIKIDSNTSLNEINAILYVQYESDHRSKMINM